MAFVRLAFTWLGVRKTSAPEQRTTAARAFHADRELLSASKLILDTKNPNGDPGWRTVLTRQGTEGTSVPTPAMLQVRQALDQLRKLGAALGLAPVEPARLPASRSGEPQDEMEKLLREAWGE